VAQQAYRFARLLFLRELRVVLVGDSQIVPDDVAFLDIDP
jgi:hypothetical protein